MVAAVTVDVAADGFNFRGNFFRASVCRAFEQHLGEQLRDAVVVGGFGQHAALERRAKFHKGQAMILFHEQAQAIGQFKFLDWTNQLFVSTTAAISASCRWAAARKACGFPP